MKISFHFLKRIHPFYYILGVLFLMLIFVSSYANSYVPYNKTSFTSYEGLENLLTVDENKEKPPSETFRDYDDDDEED